MADVSASLNENVWSEELATIRVLVRRDLTRFFREKSRVFGALMQPLIFWFVIGSGMSSTFRLPGADNVSYLEYFYPGVLIMVVLFTAIFSTMSVIEDRHSGFLQSVLVAPGSRVSVVLGKCLGSSTIALIQALLFLLLAPAAGFQISNVAWLPLTLGLGLSCIALCTVGFAVAWWIDSTAGYHVVMSVLLLPLWIVSGAMFPARPGSVLGVIVNCNPMSYAVSAVRRGIYGTALPPSMLPAGRGPWLEVLVLLAFAIVSIATAIGVCQRKR
ncbi:MAG TPA: ABC transporter permease [Polyangiales bacterium]|nr:ABC transporter permease [Polyangiales bacterium]